MKEINDGDHKERKCHQLIERKMILEVPKGAPGPSVPEARAEDGVFHSLSFTSRSFGL